MQSAIRIDYNVADVAIRCHFVKGLWYVVNEAFHRISRFKEKQFLGN